MHSKSVRLAVSSVATTKSCILMIRKYRETFSLQVSEFEFLKVLKMCCIIIHLGYACWSSVFVLLSLSIFQTTAVLHV